jgi:hypothetical protein
LGFLTLKDGTNTLSETFASNHHHSLRNNAEERSSHMFWSYTCCIVRAHPHLPNRMFNVNETCITIGPSKLPKVTARPCPLITRNWWRCAVSALQACTLLQLHFPVNECHEYCFEAKCKRAVLRRNLVDNTVFLMPHIMCPICAEQY